MAKSAVFSATNSHPTLYGLFSNGVFVRKMPVRCTMCAILVEVFGLKRAWLHGDWWCGGAFADDATLLGKYQSCWDVVVPFLCTPSVIRACTLFDAFDGQWVFHRERAWGHFTL